MECVCVLLTGRILTTLLAWRGCHQNELNATHMSSLPKLARHLSAKFGPVYEQSKLAAAAGAAPRGLARFADVLAK